MKKLMFAATVAAAMAGFAVESQVVGYQNKTPELYDSYADEELDSGCIFVTPTFRSIDGSSPSVQDIQLNAETGTGDCFLQPMDADGEYLDYEFSWLTKGDAKYYPHISVPNGCNGVWVLEDDVLEYRLPSDEEAGLAVGEMLQLFVASTDNVVVFDGQVSDAEVTYPFDFSEEEYDSGCRFVGNPFPTTMSLQGFQMSSGVGTGDAFVSRFDGNAEYVELEYVWMSQADAKYYPHISVPQGANGVWTIEDDDLEYRLPTESEGNVMGGDGFQVFAPDGSFVKILPPFEI